MTYEHYIEEHDNLGMLGDQEILADNNHNIELTLGRQQQNKVASFSFHRHGISNKK